MSGSEANVAHPLEDLGVSVEPAADTADRPAPSEPRTALLESEESCSKMVANSPDLLYVTRDDGVIAALNPTFETLTGWPRARWIGKHFTGLVHPDDVAVARASFERAAKDLVRKPLAVRILCKSGEYRLFEFLSARPRRAGDRVLVWGAARDVTDRASGNDIVRDLDALVHALIDSSMDAAVVTDESGRVVMANSKAHRVFGLPDGEAYEAGVRALLQGLDGGQAAPQDLELIRSDGSTFPARVSVVHLNRASRVWKTAYIIRDLSESAHAGALLAKAADPAVARDGRVPVCAACRRIQAEDGEWHSIESFVRDRLGAQPTLKVCPDCFSRTSK